MALWIKLLLTLVVCSTFGLLLYKLKVPGGMLLGSVLGAVALSLLFDAAYMPPTGKTIAQITAGAFIGCTIDRNDLSELRKICKPAAVMLLSLLFMNILTGFALWAVGYTDLLSAMMCAVPGGMTDVPLIAADMGADVSKVTVIHFFRMLSGVGLMPSLVMWVSIHTEQGDTTSYDTNAVRPITQTPEKTPWALVLVFAVSTIFAVTAKYLAIPSGTIMFSIIGALVLKLAGLKVRFPRIIKRLAQILSGAFIGCQMSFAGGLDIWGSALAIVISVFGFMLNSFITALYMKKHLSISIKEGMLILTPAGATDMALISADLGLMSPRLVLLQIFRLVVVTMFFPQICYLLCSFLL